MKRRISIFSLVLTLVMCLGIASPAWAENTDYIEAYPNVIKSDIPSVVPYSTSVPTKGYDLANGVYSSSFSGLTHSPMYTNYCFYVADKYFVRVRCSADTPSVPFKVHNYCVTCGQTIYDSSQYKTPEDVNELTSWKNFTMYAGADHAGHYLCPYVTNEQSKLTILNTLDGEIEVSNSKF